MKVEDNQENEQMKKVNLKEEAEKGKGLIRKLLLDPLGTIKEIVADENNQFYKTSIFIIAIWVLVVLAKEILSCIVYEYHDFSLLTTIKIVLSPILRILAMAIIIHILNKEKQEPITKSITLVSIARIPVIISSVLGFLIYISSNVTYVTSPIASLLSVISTILIFFVVKEMFKEDDDDKTLMTFVKVEAIYYVIVFAFSFLGISL